MFRPYTPDFRFELCDLAGLSDESIRGQVLLRTTLLLMKHIADSNLTERLPAIFGLLRALGRQRTVVGYLEALLTYLATATDTLSEDDLHRAIQAALPNEEEALMPTLAEQWFTQGQQQGQQQGQAALLMRQLELRFGPLPETIRERIQAAEPATLLLWGERVLTARHLDEVFNGTPEGSE